jgi:hypothetical protein
MKCHFKSIAFILLCALAVSLCPVTPASAQMTPFAFWKKGGTAASTCTLANVATWKEWEGGGWTEADPYLITNVCELQAMKNKNGFHFALANDIDASSTSSWNAGAGFTPIGSSGNQWFGTFDGRGHVISGLTIQTGFGVHAGLIGYTYLGGPIKNVGLTDVNVKGWFAGGLVGYASNTNISNVYVTGTVTGNGPNVHDCAKVGGIAGFLHDSTITGSNSTATVSNCPTICPQYCHN